MVLLLKSIFFSPIVALNCKKPLVPVKGFAQAFVGDARIYHARIRILETGATTFTNRIGAFQFCVQPNRQITLLFKKESFLPWNNYLATQSATVVVSKYGLQGLHHEVTFQVPRVMVFALLKHLISRQRAVTLDPRRCNVVTTITALNKTLYDDPQGEPGATLQLSLNGQPYAPQNKPYYFAVKNNKTYPFSPKLNVTSEDGGVLIYNLKPNKQPYTLTAIKKGKRFTRVQFICKPNVFINVSPPWGPSERG